MLSPDTDPVSEALESRLADVELLTFDIDGTLTDATTWWAGEGVGWVQRYSVRDGEAILRMARAGLKVVPLSRNKTTAARVRMEHLRCATDWLGVSDKIAALEEIRARHGGVEAGRVLHIGDGIDDAPVFEAVGVGVAVADAHPGAREAAAWVLAARGGERVMEVLEFGLRRAQNRVLMGTTGISEVKA
ncbi:HAD hydrolase family protein [Pseudenhygromyxa sp. WMMC2535]|uniref:HAD hydrolase family protein n=1 Tax=Pseudenhygromyxa sp. WMMC2535 TaxID=2712867 RepID=UPI0015528CAD|nr:HAD hydrolase family protein [Pseudenhygromyxa sp. WMMC2535]NVB41751.1 HAD hydrolase family protein [Pseudenhygromyxa sp. WMMC2535]